jgi:hypothetical protein
MCVCRWLGDYFFLENINMAYQGGGRVVSADAAGVGGGHTVIGGAVCV